MSNELKINAEWFESASTNELTNCLHAIQLQLRRRELIDRTSNNKNPGQWVDLIKRMAHYQVDKTVDGFESFTHLTIKFSADGLIGSPGKVDQFEIIQETEESTYFHNDRSCDQSNLFDWLQAETGSSDNEVENFIDQLVNS